MIVKLTILSTVCVNLTSAHFSNNQHFNQLRENMIQRLKRDKHGHKARAYKKLSQPVLSQMKSKYKFNKANETSESEPLYTQSYYGDYLATIGLEDKKFSLLADTGSSLTWFSVCDPLTMPECPSYYYDTLKSTSLKCSNEQDFISYGDGTEITGQICKDYISSGGKKTYMDFML